jgi:hypothetical protein
LRFQILLQVKEQNGPQGIAFSKIAAGVGPVGMGKFQVGAAVGRRREIEANGGANGIARAHHALPLDVTSRIGLHNLPFENGAVLGPIRENFAGAGTALHLGGVPFRQL